ncbi:PQQ-like beta-propeller repeat protein [candidate division KSB1 bacterium]|nr:PQQ-like beta-propeller repeat protein [candidate division KSB1 bacterium]
MKCRLLFACSLPCIALLSFGWSFNQKSADSKSKQAASSTSDWPQWLGPNRNGISAEIGLLKSWPATGPKILWRIPLGAGFSGISISQGRAYTLFAQGNDEFVVCLDAASGKELWRTRSDSTFKDANGNGPRSTPTVHNEVVYALGAHGNLFALQTASGKKLWSHDLKNEFKSSGPSRDGGFSTSPLIEGGLLLVEAGGREGNSFIAFNKQSGAVVWKVKSDGAAFASPIAITVNGVRQYKEKAAAEILDGRCITVPALAAGKLYVRNTKELVCLDMFGQY